MKDKLLQRVATTLSPALADIKEEAKGATVGGTVTRGEENIPSRGPENTEEDKLAD